MPDLSYQERRRQIATYFDRTAAEAWSRLTSDAPVSRIRATVRAGRTQMRETLLGWLPQDLRGRRILDAGCGTGALAVEAARRGAHVVAIDVAPTLVELARERLPGDLGPGAVEFRVGDMLDGALGEFDHVVAMDSLIHYQPNDMLQILARLAARTGGSMLFTFAPRTVLLAMMHGVGRFFPRGDRAPSIVPVELRAMQRLLRDHPRLAAWDLGRSIRVVNGFYTSQAMELVRR